MEEGANNPNFDDADHTQSNETDAEEEEMSIIGSDNNDDDDNLEMIAPRILILDANGAEDEYLDANGAEDEYHEYQQMPTVAAPANDSVHLDPNNIPVPPRRLGDILIQAIRHPLRLTRQFRIHHRSQPNSEDELGEEDDISPGDILNFDTDLPAEHSYLGPSMERVSGVNYREVGKLYRMLVFPHKTLLFPGETLPMMIPPYWLDPSLYPEDEGIQFGLIFPSTMNENNIYGITCQIYETGQDESQNVLLKSRANQRFVITRKDNPNFDEIAPQSKSYAHIKILPEIYLPDPLKTVQLGSLNRFRDLPSMERKLRQFQAFTTVWPCYEYEPYNIDKILEKAKRYLESYKIKSIPTDPVILSFWLGRNLLFNANERYKIFLTNSVNVRMQIIDKSLDDEKFFCCARCKSRVANCNSLFAMSKSGVQSNYVNPGGCIHETNTVYKLVKDSVFPTGQPSTEFSWFPGYSWQIILCRLCDMHLGWKFASTKQNLIPKQFYGLSGANLEVRKLEQSIGLFAG